MKGPDRRAIGWIGALALLLVVPLSAGYSHWDWDAAQFLGWIGTLACLALCGAAIRPRQGMPPRILSLKRHSSIGWVALIAVLSHVAGLLYADRLVAEYLRPSMPRFQLAGLAAAVMLIVVIATSVTAARRNLWKSHRGFQATHVILSCLLVLTLAVHVLVTDRYAGGAVRRTLYLAVSGAALLLLLRPRSPAAGESAAPGGVQALAWHRRLAFGRHSQLVAWVVVGCVVLSCALWVGSARGALREPLVARSEPLPLDFPHTKHVQVNCLTCHHNFADGTGMDNCVLCHKSDRPDLKLGVQARFHGFCLECHRHPQSSLHGKSGPVSECGTCHRAAQTAH